MSSESAPIDPIDSLPEVELPLPPAEQGRIGSAARRVVESGITRVGMAGGAALGGALAIGLNAGKAAAGNLKSNVAAEIQADKSADNLPPPDATITYTRMLAKEAAEGKANFGFIHGVAIFDDKTKIYRTINPNLNSKPIPHHMIGGKNADVGKFAVSSGAGVFFDSKDQEWLVISFKSRGPNGRIARGQATDVNQWLCIPYVGENKKHIRVLLYDQVKVPGQIGAPTPNYLSGYVQDEMFWSQVPGYAESDDINHFHPNFAYWLVPQDAKPGYNAAKSRNSDGTPIFMTKTQLNHVMARIGIPGQSHVATLPPSEKLKAIFNSSRPGNGG